MFTYDLQMVCEFRKERQMEISIQVKGYNPRRYGRPWIARITEWEEGETAVMKFGSFTGNDDGGEVSVVGNIGDVVRWGQKDYRGNNTTNFWGIVQDSGQVEECSPVEAKAHFRKVNCNVNP